MEACKHIASTVQAHFLAARVDAEDDPDDFRVILYIILGVLV